SMASDSGTMNTASSPFSPAGSAPGAPRAARSYQTDAMLFVGAGTWSAEVDSLRSILQNHGASFREVGSSELDGMSVDEISSFGLLIFPGGSGGTEAESL